MLELLKTIPEKLWDIIKFIAELIWDIMSTIFTFLINIVFSIFDQIIKFYFNIITTIFNNYSSIFIIIIVITLGIYIYKVKNYKFNNFLNKKVILNTLAIFFILVPLLTFFLGYVTNYFTSNNNVKKTTNITQDKLQIKDKNIPKPKVNKIINKDINITKIVNDKIIEQNKFFKKKFKLQQDSYDVKIQTLEQKINLLNNSLKNIEKRLYDYDNDFSFYSKKIKLINNHISNKEKTKDNNSTVKKGL
jgi:hypothetical protein